jgi:Lon protease-like protein
MARDLPIFPLPLVLFPGVPQALHIFEPRYRRMLYDCLAGDRRFGIAYHAGGPDDPDPAPPTGQVGCVAHIRSADQLSDGRSNILTVGERRFVIDAWLDAGQPYRVARVREFTDADEDATEIAPLAAAIRQAFDRLLAALAVLADGPAERPELPPDPEGMSFHVAAALDLDAPVKQALLETRSTLARLRRLGPLVTALAADVERRAAVHRRGRGNGKGGPGARVERTG